MKILVVDDFPKMRKVIISILRNLDAEFIECGDGTDAIEQYTLHHPNYVLMDVELLTMDGITATREIRKKYPEARIVMVTNYNDPQLITTAKDAGAIGYILKDNLQELRNIIR